MSIVTVRMEDDILARIDKRIKQYPHKKRSDFIREAIIARLEDIEDLDAFEETKNDKTYTLAEVRKHLGVAN